MADVIVWACLVGLVLVAGYLAFGIPHAMTPDNDRAPVLRQCPRYAVLWVDDTGGWNLLALHMTEEEANDLAAQYAVPTGRMTQIVVAKLEPLDAS